MWNDIGEAASAAAAGNLFHSEMVQATNDPWSCAVTAPMVRNKKWWISFVCPSPVSISSSSADTAELFRNLVQLVEVWHRGFSIL